MAAGYPLASTQIERAFEFSVAERSRMVQISFSLKGCPLSDQGGLAAELQLTSSMTGSFGDGAIKSELRPGGRPSAMIAR